MAHKFPPKGYNALAHPLPHNFEYQFSLAAENATKDATIITLFRSSQAVNAAESIEVNPTNASFGEETGPLNQMNSIVPKVSFNMKCSMTKGAIETDKMRSLQFKWMPIYTAFLDSLEAYDIKSNQQIEDILELQHDVTNQDTYPLFSNVDLGTNVMPMSTKNATEVFGDVGLTTDTKLESVAFDEDDFWDTLSYKSNAAKLRKQIGQIHNVNVTRDRPYSYYSNNATFPTVKRGNMYTFCGILIWLPQAGGLGQVFKSGDTTDIDHLYVTASVRYDEWNPDFDQTAY